MGVSFEGNVTVLQLANRFPTVRSRCRGDDDAGHVLLVTELLDQIVDVSEVMGSRPVVGSSYRTIRGLPMIARAIATLRIPPRARPA
jgi:hypothetical protein